MDRPRHSLFATILAAALVCLSVAPARGATPETILSPDGESAGDQFGMSVAGVGDVNQDGFGDVIVGAPENDAGAGAAGRAYVYFGAATPDETPDLVLTGLVQYERFGSSVGGGDVNGDGIPDLIVGAPFTGGVGSNPGHAYVFFGGAGMDAVPDRVFGGVAAHDRFGAAVAAIGDFNGDTFGDLAVGAPSNDVAGGEAGTVYVYFGGADADTLPDLVLVGDPGDQFGTSLAAAGDVNDDGYADLIVGAWSSDVTGSNDGRAFLFLGGAAPDSTADLILAGAAELDEFGLGVGGGVDVNDDGFDDIVVGAAGNDAGGDRAGRAYVYFGAPVPDGTADWVLTGGQPGELLGYSVSGAGDVNGDGFGDVAVGLRDAGAYFEGRLHVYFGGPAPDPAADLVLSGTAIVGALGFAVGGAGDVNGDGRDEVIAGVPNTPAGSAVVVGAASLLPAAGPAALPVLAIVLTALGAARTRRRARV